MAQTIRHARLRVLLVSALLVVIGIALAAPAGAQQGGATLDLIEVNGVIDPVTADYLSDRLAAAEQDGVEAAVIQLDTPGGLDVSMREIVRDILESEVPVVVWVAPRGARAASAGTFITYAAHLAYMADATEIGAATPVNLGGSDIGGTLEEKVINDAAAFIRELAIQRDRNPEWAESAVRDAAALGATEAERIDVVNGVVSSLDGLLESMDGTTVAVADETETVLETWDESAGAPSVTVRFQDMNPFQRLLHIVTDSEIAYLLLLVGIFGIIFELYNPGIGLAGILGAVSLLLAFYGLSILPTNWAGVALIGIAIAFFVADLQTAGMGAWTIGGVVALVAGGILLFAGASPELRLSGWAIGASVVGTLIFFMSVLTAALRVRLRRPITGEEGIVGATAEAKTDIAPEGTVLTKGTLWRARTMETGIAAGSRVKVKATEGLVLLVEPLHDGEEELALSKEE
ncbi:MAG: nodulation protein NfeD [Actinomycetota bacterium]|nr:nodulation protein NfeD [Actinomycetota bacterium]